MRIIKRKEPIMSKETDYPKMGKRPQVRNPALDPKSMYYDPELAKRRKKEKARRKANRLNRRR